MCDGNGNCNDGCASLGKFGAKCDLACQDSHSNYKCAKCTGQDIESMKCLACASRFDYVARVRWCTRCPRNCRNGTCGEGGVCHGCNDGLTGDQCSSNCLSTCKQCEQSGCLLCQNGYFGDECDQECSSNCLNSTCEKDAGRCIQGCAAGFHGDRCDKRGVSNTGGKYIISYSIHFKIINFWLH